MKDKIYTMLGFAQKSGNLVTGENTCEIYLNKRKISLLIISDDASENSKKKFVGKCEAQGVNYRVFGNRDEISHSIGKSNRPIVGVTNKKFSRKLIELIDEDNNLDCDDNITT